jgi:hypothetical protein
MCRRSGLNSDFRSDAPCRISRHDSLVNPPSRGNAWLDPAVRGTCNRSAAGCMGAMT